MIVGACGIARILAPESDVGCSFSSSVRLRSVRLGFLVCHSSFLSMKFRTYVICTLYFGSAVRSQEERRTSLIVVLLIRGPI